MNIVGDDDLVILVDENDNETGIAGKMETHRRGRLHRAFSIFIFNDEGTLLLQKRAVAKYHSGGLWSNTCCGHPRPGESIADASRRRLLEEMGIDCACREVFSFLYKVDFDNNLSEFEYDHVMMGICNQDPQPAPEEACDWQWIALSALQNDIKERPDQYTYWLKRSLDAVMMHAAV
jgi:isopentenyl-diphosphate delta-isomerase